MRTSVSCQVRDIVLVRVTWWFFHASSICRPLRYRRWSSFWVCSAPRQHVFVTVGSAYYYYYYYYHWAIVVYSSHWTRYIYRSNRHCLLWEYDAYPQHVEDLPYFILLAYLLIQLLTCLLVIIKLYNYYGYSEINIYTIHQPPLGLDNSITTTCKLFGMILFTAAEIVRRIN